MASLRASLAGFGWRRLVFSLVVLVTLGLFGFLGVVLWQLDVIGGLLGQNTATHAGQHFRSLHHRIHDLTFSFLFGTAVVGLLAQLRTPSKNVAGQLMALIPWGGLVLVFPLTNYWVYQGTGFVLVATAIFGGLTLLAAVLHPTGRDFFRSFSVSRVNWVLVVLVIIAAVPLLAFASTTIGLQRTVTNDHAALGHYGFMAAFSFTIIGVGLLASLRPDGWRLPAWVAGLLPILLGLASVLYPDADSSLGLVWALAAITWGVVFVAAAELTQQPRATEETPQADLSPYPATGHATGTPRWPYVSGIIAIVLVLLFGIIYLIGGGLAGHISSGGAGHTPPSGGHENTGGVGGPAAANQALRTVEVTTLDTMTFEPSRINVSAGETVMFVVTNTGQAVHEFTFGNAAMQQEHADKMAQMGDGMAHNGPNSMTLQPGETKQLTWRFGHTGTLEYGCHEPGHYQAGMRGQITIT